MKLFNVLTIASPIEVPLYKRLTIVLVYSMGTTLGLVTLMDIERSISTATIGTTESVSQFSLKPFKRTSVTSNLGVLGQILYNTPTTTTIATMANNMASNTSVVFFFFFFFLLCVLESRTLTSVFFYVPETRTLPPSSFSSSSPFFLTQRTSCIPPPNPISSHRHSRSKDVKDCYMKGTLKKENTLFS